MIEALVGVYNAEGSLRGELIYVLGRITGRAHCALCDITHGIVRRRRSFDACRAGLPVPFELVHLDERTDEVSAASEGRTPCILARTEAGISLVLDPDQLEACEGEPARLVDAIRQAVDALGLRWPANSRQ